MLKIVIIVSIAIIVGLIGYVIRLRYDIKKTLNMIDLMLTRATANNLSCNTFDESKMSKIESKMYDFLLTNKKTLESNDEEKNNIKTFIADISHQTKTPIANIVLYTDLLMETKNLDDKQKEVAMQIKMQSDKLSFLISSLVKLSRLENGIVNIDAKEYDLEEIASKLNFEEIAGKKNIKLEVEDMKDIKAKFDLKWTVEAISNIIDNAIKYTNEGGMVKVSAREYEMFSVIEVKDNGVGIKEEEIAQIFTRFYRSTRTNKESGVGIGLYLAREIIEKENGYIKVSTKLDEGSTFSIFLPKS